MDANLANWITAGATVVYTIGTFLLWNSTRKSLDATRDAFKLTFLMAIHEIERPSPSVGTPDSRIPLFVRTIVPNKHRKRIFDLLKRTFPDEYESIMSADTDVETTRIFDPGVTRENATQS